MNVSQDSAPMDYMDYFINQLPRNLATMAALRDELAVRQGALSAAQDAVADRAKAAEELAAARATAAEMVSGAKDARAALKVTQKDFATLLGVSLRTLHQWEQGRRKPTGAALTLLRVARANPRAVMQAASV